MTELVYEGRERIQNINVRPFVTFVYDYSRSCIEYKRAMLCRRDRSETHVYGNRCFTVSLRAKW
jgi:hypothetical protein